MNSYLFSKNSKSSYYEEHIRDHPSLGILAIHRRDHSEVTTTRSSIETAHNIRALLLASTIVLAT